MQQFDRAITGELDFSSRRENGERFARTSRARATSGFPKVYKQASSKHVLTLEFFDGIKVDEAIAQGLLAASAWRGTRST